jgi:hypothetical protein
MDVVYGRTVVLRDVSQLELALFEEKVGFSIRSAASMPMEGRPRSVDRAFLWLERRRLDPSFTYEDAGKITVKEWQEKL